MSDFDIHTLQPHIQAIAHSHSQVRLVYLFGSSVDGEIGVMSDVDLAVLLTHDSPLFHTRAQLTHLFSIALASKPIDLIILNVAPVELAYAVIAQGKLLYQRELAERIEYEANIMSRYGDYLPLLRAQRQDILKGEQHERRVQRYRAALGRTQRSIGAPATLK
ncbi:MAG TPA: nucleotidyltransferase domain-containing protein [Chloroflexi bacterium]|nr:nucleotidyltransferase domain-containing protein [Chloroflexota bacterium]